MIKNCKVPPSSMSLGKARRRTFEVFRTCNLHSPGASEFRRNAHLTNPKEPWHNKVEKVALNGSYANIASSIEDLSIKGLPLVAERLVLGMKSEGFLLDISTLSALMLCYANNGLLSKAQAVWDEILNSSFVLDVRVVAKLIDIYGCMGYFDMVVKILHQVQMKDSSMVPRVYALAISCFGKRGQLQLMEITLKEMVSMGFPVDSATGNAYVIYYSRFGSLSEMERAYMRLKRSRILVEEEAIRSISTAYIKEEKFYYLGQFLRDVGLGRKNVGNLLWNLLLLSYAAKFKMKSLQREFVRMVEYGFRPDLTTFNIRAMAFSKMCLFWDLHVSLEHMKHEKVVPDLVTYGSVVDAYLDRRLGRNLDFALNKMNVNDRVAMLTDPLIFEAMGKGDFHLSSDAFLEFSRKQSWTYKELIRTYLKKKFRSNQIFWNY
ncbi:PREDICTED: pentatricopeptide repeat-containing protein At3g42630-like [Ipomoea nil]|uniref:pentatricopeptide repeat-containing protein At3g42630-like n=1 Tax=Ipomoea nil TaxID=35883 RepID=UPI000901E164|nr:PREDICTED: pentatricopeptide repeat-containing protein At3g42630-like [Ipomoea nil]XP_019155610.1 PREDICTED: pentatricopeptide repeat-containing protein At3g42630-like [Ipomoea nil]